MTVRYMFPDSQYIKYIDRKEVTHMFSVQYINGSREKCINHLFTNLPS